MDFPKFADRPTDGHMEKKVTPKDPLRINARDLKNNNNNLKRNRIWKNLGAILQFLFINNQLKP